jgi:hypothetical protein
MVHQAENRWGFPPAKVPFDSPEKSIYTVWHDLIILDLEPGSRERDGGRKSDQDRE